MDVHLPGEEIDLEEVRKNHKRDLAVQHKYGVQHLHYYLNSKQGVAFCLMLGPDKESCISVHREAHGDVANNIIEVDKSNYEILMGNVHSTDSDLVQSIDGLPDLGYRFVLFVELIGVSAKTLDLTSTIHTTILKNGGRISPSQGDRVITFFSACNNAVHCAAEINQLSAECRNIGIDLKVGLAPGEPVTQMGLQLFGDTVKLAGMLARAAPSGKCLVSHKTQEFYQGDLRQISPSLSLHLISLTQEGFLERIIEHIEDQLKSENPSVKKLSNQMGVSRPQLYRKVKALTGSSPKEFIRDLRLFEATRMIKTGDGNISDIAYKLNFSHPSIFSKQFKQRFDISPSEAVRRMANSDKNPE